MSQNRQRPYTLVGNWKMYKTVEESLQFVETLAPIASESQATVLLAAPFTTLLSLSKKVQELKASIVIGAQNMHDASEGAFTGEIAAKMLIDVGAQFVLLGHSERRHLFNESSSFINKKVKKALDAGIEPILCVGETLEERESGRTEEVLKEQLAHSLEGIASLSRLILAYEPVWAIGTGKVATPEEAELAHQLCRAFIAEKWGKQEAEQLSILYGGSVKPENAKELLMQKNVDGLLVGGASLKPDSFIKIIEVANTL